MTTRAAFHTWASARRAPSVPTDRRDGPPTRTVGVSWEVDASDTAELALLVPSEAELVTLGLPPAPPAELVAAVLRQVRRAETPAYRRWLWRLGDVLRRAA